MAEDVHGEGVCASESPAIAVLVVASGAGILEGESAQFAGVSTGLGPLQSSPAVVSFSLEPPTRHAPGSTKLWLHPTLEHSWARPVQHPFSPSSSVNCSRHSLPPSAPPPRVIVGSSSRPPRPRYRYPPPARAERNPSSAIVSRPLSATQLSSPLSVNETHAFTIRNEPRTV
jgi:hypothetical protein